MSRERHRRAQKIVNARQRRLDLAEAELASLTRKTLEANQAWESARAAWKARMESRPRSECTSDDLALEHAYLLTLEKRAKRLAEAARDAKAKEDGARLEVCKARTEHKKVETWRDRLIEAYQLEEARLERLQNDEIAARISRKT